NTTVSSSGWASGPSPSPRILNGVAIPIHGASPDTQAPTAPTNLTATPVSSTQINLNWTASTDDFGVTGYLIEQCVGSACTTFTQSGTTFSSPGLAPATTYSYRVRATDAAGNTSLYSNTATTTTSASSDSQAPTAPATLTTISIASSQINLSWSAS